MALKTDFREDADAKTSDDLNSIPKQTIPKNMSDSKNMLRERKMSEDEHESSDEHEDKIKQNSSQMKVTKFLKKYFLEGQKLDGDVKPLVDEDVPFWKKVVSSRRFWGIIIPLIFFEVCYYLCNNKKFQGRSYLANFAYFIIIFNFYKIFCRYVGGP